MQRRCKTDFRLISCIATAHHLPYHYDDVIKWQHFPRYGPFVREIRRPPVNSQHKGQWRGALMFSLICFWMNGWVNNREAVDLRRYRDHHDIIVMIEMISCPSLGNSHKRSAKRRPPISSQIEFGYLFLLSWFYHLVSQLSLAERYPNVSISHGVQHTNTKWYHAIKSWLGIGSGHDLMPSSQKPQPKPMLTHRGHVIHVFTWEQFHRDCLKCTPVKCGLTITDWKLQSHMVISVLFHIYIFVIYNNKK